MRDDLERNVNNGIIEFEAEVGYRRSGNVRFGGRPSIQKLLLNVRNSEHEIKIDHLVLTVGKEIPAVPNIYDRIMPGMKICFLGEIFPYVRKLDGTPDFSIKIKKLVESKKDDIQNKCIDRSSLKEAWLNGQLSSKEYLRRLSKGRR